MAASYLSRSRHGTAYHFRRRVPDDLRDALGRAFIVKSVGTADRRTAIIRARALAAHVDRIFAQLRTMPKNQIRTDFGFKLDLNELGRPASVTVTDAKPEDQGAIVNIIQEVLSGSPSASIAPEATPAAATGDSPSMTLSDAIDEFLERGSFSTSTRRTYRSRLKRAIAHFGGERDIRSIEQADLSAFARHTLDNIPDQNTASLSITTLAGLLNHYRINNGWGAELTTNRLLPRSKTPDSNDRDAYTLDQLGVILENARQYLDTEPAKYWVTAAAAFTGCRIEELAQLELPYNLGYDESARVWWIDLNANPDVDGKLRRSMKNKASWRMVPLHSALVRAGFVQFLNAQVEAGRIRPFESQWQPLLGDNKTRPDEGMKWSHYITNWGGRELTRLTRDGKIARGRLSYFHSMRHTITQLLLEARIDAEVSEALLGRTYTGGDRERYAKLKTKPLLLSREGVESGLENLAKLFAEIEPNAR